MGERLRELKQKDAAKQSSWVDSQIIETGRHQVIFRVSCVSQPSFTNKKPAPPAGAQEICHIVPT